MRIPVPFGTSLILGGIVVAAIGVPILFTEGRGIGALLVLLGAGIVWLAFWVRRRNGL